MTDLPAIAIVCGHTPSPKNPSSEVLAPPDLDELENHGVTAASLHAVEHETESETDDQGLPIMFGKVATITVVGNEDGARVRCLPGYLAARIALHTGSALPVAASSAYSVGDNRMPLY